MKSFLQRCPALGAALILIVGATVARGVAEKQLADVVVIDIADQKEAGVALVRRGPAWRLCVGAAGYVPVTREVPSLGELNAATISADLDAIDDAAGSADYKRHLVRVLVDRVVVAAAKEAAE